ncbi:hypothetical protein JZ751_021734, partial [Albula glossodonta]
DEVARPVGQVSGRGEAQWAAGAGAGHAARRRRNRIRRERRSSERAWTGDGLSTRPMAGSLLKQDPSIGRSQFTVTQYSVNQTTENKCEQILRYEGVCCCVY